MHLTTPSPLGLLELRATDRGISHVRFLPEGAGAGTPVRGNSGPAQAHLQLAATELAAYFAGERSDFTVSLDPAGTDFQQRVWRALCSIPAGHTVSYGDIARQIGKAGGSQAVGLANGANPLAIIVPCHRVVGTGGKLTGYAGGIERKQWLLRHEGAALL